MEDTASYRAWFSKRAARGFVHHKFVVVVDEEGREVDLWDKILEEHKRWCRLRMRRQDMPTNVKDDE